MTERIWSSCFCCAAVALAIWGRADARAAEPNQLTDEQEKILAELESRWWGWRGESAPIVPAPKSWTSLDQVWRLSSRQEVVVAIGPEPSPQESYIAEMLRRELTGKHHIACRVTTVTSELTASGPIICLGTCESNVQVAKLCQTKEIDPRFLKRPESYSIDFASIRG